MQFVEYSCQLDGANSLWSVPLSAEFQKFSVLLKSTLLFIEVSKYAFVATICHY